MRYIEQLVQTPNGDTWLRGVAGRTQSELKKHPLDGLHNHHKVSNHRQQCGPADSDCKVHSRCNPPYGVTPRPMKQVFGLVM